MEYPIEIKIASKNGWFTPSESNAYYKTKYARNGITWHHWGDGTGASNHDNIVNYMLNQARLGKKSCNYVLSDNKITLLVGPDNVAWCSGPGNPTTISVELQPTLGDEGYKKAGWLAWQLEDRYHKDLLFYPHKYWASTSCPGSISLDKILQEKLKWKRGEYNPAPPPPPSKPTIDFFEYAEGVRKFVFNKDATLWNFNVLGWPVNPVKSFKKNEEVDIKGYAINRNLGTVFMLTPYSFDKKVTNGFLEVDLNLKQQPVPPVDPPPTPEPEKPEWEKNLRDIDDTKMWIIKDTSLKNIQTGGEASPSKLFAKDEEFVASALTSVRGVEYRLTDYSFKKGVFNGIPTSDLTLTKPGQVDVPPVPENPNTVDKNVVITFLESIVKLISDFINKLKG